MTENEQKLAILALDADRSWKILDAAHRSMPDCEHNQHWQAALADAQDDYRKALARRDRQMRKMAKLDDEGTAEAV